MWDILLQNLPTVILVTVAVIICGAELIKALQVWRDEHDKKVKGQIEHQEKEKSIQEAIDIFDKKLDTLLDKIDRVETRMQTAENRLDKLTVSDMHDIKSWIVEQYHKFYTSQGWIDAFSAETIDRRYEDYKAEGGNSYIDNLISQLHTLSMDPEEKTNNNNNNNN